MRVVSFVSGSILHSALSCVVVAQIAPAPAATVHTLDEYATGSLTS